MNYCNYDVGSNSGNSKNNNSGYFCDFTEKYYQSYKDCYDNCGLTFDKNIIHISNVDFTFIIGIWAVLLAVSLFWAFHLSHD